MPRKISPHAELPRFQIFCQRRGSKEVELLNELYDQRDVRNDLAMIRRYEEKNGKRCVENGHGGFSAYTGSFEKPQLRAVYWSEEIMTDAEINSDESPIDEAILIDIGIARSWVFFDQKAKQEAAEAGINFEPGDGE